jgi:hypothetical protein
MNVPEPVMSLAIQPISKDSGGQVSAKEMDFSHDFVALNL